jgi:hypothetical protein
MIRVANSFDIHTFFFIFIEKKFLDYSKRFYNYREFATVIKNNYLELLLPE